MLCPGLAPRDHVGMALCLQSCLLGKPLKRRVQWASQMSPGGGSHEDGVGRSSQVTPGHPSRPAPAVSILWPVWGYSEAAKVTPILFFPAERHLLLTPLHPNPQTKSLHRCTFFSCFPQLETVPQVLPLSEKPHGP